jgi:hypothetical protein
MLWSTVVQTGIPRQAETAVEAKNPGRNQDVAPVGMSPAPADVSVARSGAGLAA